MADKSPSIRGQGGAGVGNGATTGTEGGAGGATGGASAGGAAGAAGAATQVPHAHRRLPPTGICSDAVQLGQRTVTNSGFMECSRVVMGSPTPAAERWWGCEQCQDPTASRRRA